MFHLHSVTGRVAIGKTIGFFVGLMVMLFLPAFDMPIFGMFGLGTLLMFMLMGVMTGFMGMYDRHPAVSFKMPWWVSGGVVGFSFMLMYILFTYNSLEIIMQSAYVSWMGFESPFWALLDGASIGMIMGFVETKLAGEGEKLPLK